MPLAEINKNGGIDTNKSGKAVPKKFSSMMQLPQNILKNQSFISNRDFNFSCLNTDRDAESALAKQNLVTPKNHRVRPYDANPELPFVKNRQQIRLPSPNKTRMSENNSKNNEDLNDTSEL